MRPLDQPATIPTIDPSDMTRGGIKMGDFRKLLREKMALLKLDDSFAARYVNEGFSAARRSASRCSRWPSCSPRWRSSTRPTSGLDIDALRIVAEGVNAQLNPDLGVLLITHYQRILNYINARRRARPGQGPDRRVGRTGPCAAARGRGLRSHPARGGAGAGRRGRARDARAGGSRHEPTEAQEGAQQPWPSSRRSTRSRSALTSRSSSASSAAAGWPTSTVPRPASSRASWPRRWSRYLNHYSANVHRGIYEIGEEATAAYEGARSKIASVHRRQRRARRSIMVRNATEAINLVAYAWGRKNIGKADTIVTTEMEHHSNIIPWQMLTQEKDADLEFVPFDEEGRLNQDSFEVLLRTKPKLVAFTAVSNGIGTINPVKEMVAQGARGRRAGARRRRPGRAARAGQRPGPGLRLLRLLAATRRSARQAPARSGRGARSSRRCRRSWAAAR